MDRPCARVVVIDDDLDSREVFSEFMRLRGIVVEGFATAEAALASCGTDMPAAVVTDITLSEGIDGYEAARRLRALPGSGSLRIFAMTGYASEAVEEQARGLFDGVFTKPLDPETLADAVERSVRGG